MKGEVVNVVLPKGDKRIVTISSTTSMLLNKE
jgi:hypothetical protein